MKNLCLGAAITLLNHATYAQSSTDTVQIQSRIHILLTTNEPSRMSDVLFIDGKISIDLDDDGTDESIINYSYNKIGPPNFENGNDKISEPVITIDIDTPKENLKVSYLCSSIGIYKEKNNGYRDIFCGPSFRLKWNGSEYSE